MKWKLVIDVKHNLAKAGRPDIYTGYWGSRRSSEYRSHVFFNVLRNTIYGNLKLKRIRVVKQNKNSLRILSGVLGMDPQQPSEQSVTENFQYCGLRNRTTYVFTVCAALDTKKDIDLFIWKGEPSFQLIVSMAAKC